MKKIVVDIEKNGELKTEVFGVTGAGCLAETKDLHEALGKVEKTTPKPEMGREPELHENVKTGG